MKIRTQLTAGVLSVTSTMVVLGLYLYLKQTVGFYFQYDRAGVLTALWFGATISMLAILTAIVSLFRPSNKKFAPVLFMIIALLSLLFIVFYMTPWCRLFCPEHLKAGSWSDPAKDFSRAIKRGDHRKIVLASHLGYESPGWESGKFVYPKVILTEKIFETMTKQDALAIYTTATNYATAYNQLLWAHLEKQNSETSNK